MHPEYSEQTNKLLDQCCVRSAARRLSALQRRRLQGASSSGRSPLRFNPSLRPPRWGRSSRPQSQLSGKRVSECQQLLLFECSRNNRRDKRCCALALQKQHKQNQKKKDLRRQRSSLSCASFSLSASGSAPLQPDTEPGVRPATASGRRA